MEVCDEVKIDKDTLLQSISRGTVTLEEAARYIAEYINDEPEAEYEIAVGTDSMTYDVTKFALAIIVHRKNTGAIFFIKRMYHKQYKKNMLHEKLVAETQISLDTSLYLLDEMLKYNIDLTDEKSNIQFKVHMDIGHGGPTKEYIDELEGWVKAYGLKYEIKPNSYASSTIANKYCK